MIMKLTRWPIALVAALALSSASVAHAQQALDKLEGILDAEDAAEPKRATPTPVAPTPAPRPMPKASAFRPGYLGLYAIEVDDKLIVETVRPDSPAAAAKLRPGDEIVRLGAARPRNLDEMSAALGELGVGARLPIIVTRGEVNLSLIAVLGERPAPARVADTSPAPTPADPSGDALGALRELDELLEDIPPDEEPAAGESRFLKRMATLEAELKLIHTRMEILERTLDRVEKTSDAAP